MSTAPDEKKEPEIEGELSWSGVKIPDHFHLSWWGVVFPMVTLTMSTYQIHTDTEWRFFKIIGRILAAILTLTACYIHALTIKHAVTPKFWHGFHPKQT